MIGWILSWTLRLTAGTTVLKNEVLFGWYAIGLVIGFRASFASGLGRYGKQEWQL